jgi:hypothetical protein
MYRKKVPITYKYNNINCHKKLAHNPSSCDSDGDGGVKFDESSYGSESSLRSIHSYQGIIT